MATNEKIQTNKAKFAIGQEIWFNPRAGYKPSFKDTVAKIGRKYLKTTKGHRIDLEELWFIDEYGGYAGEFFLSNQALLEEDQKMANFKAIRERVNLVTQKNPYTLQQSIDLLAILSQIENH